MEQPKTLEEANRIIKKMISRESKSYHEMLVAKARAYDLITATHTDPEDIELKSKIIYLTDEIKNVIKSRDSLKKELRIARNFTFKTE